MAIGITDFLSNQLIDDSPIIKLREKGESFAGDFSVTWKLKKGLFNPGQYYVSIYAINAQLNTVKRYERVRSFKFISSTNEDGLGKHVLRAAFNIDLDIKIKRH